MNRESLAALGDANMAAEWASLGRHAGFNVGETESMTLMASGIPVAYFNGAFAHARSSDPERCIAEAITFFGDGVPFLLWLREGPYDNLIDAGRAAGLRDVGGPPSMALAAIGDIGAPPSELHLRLATTPDDMRDHRALLAGAFGLPSDILERVIVD